MDFHKIENVTIEDVKTAHIADVAVQNKYKVKYHQFWVNEEAGAVFCLVEGPDKETCQAVHIEAHGNIACALTEVEPGFYGVMMGEGQKVDEGYVQNEDGTVDLGFRYILVASVYGVTTATNSKNLSELRSPHGAKKQIAGKIVDFKGRKVNWDKDDSIIGVFNDPLSAVECAVNIQELLSNQNSKIVLKLGLSAAQPVTSKGDFFKDAIKLAHRLSIIASNNQILISSSLRQLCEEEILINDKSSVKMLTDTEEEFVLKLLTIAEDKLSDSNFSLDVLSNEICVSRPQLYRKITAVTGRSPNDFIRAFRMDKACLLLKQKSANISEIAYEVGFSTPSYFTKCFLDRYGCTPSAFAHSNNVDALNSY